MNELATVGLHSSLSLGQRAGVRAGGADAPQQLAREFDAMVWRLLWRTTSAPGAAAGKSTLASPLADLVLPQIAAQHSAGFGAMVLNTLGEAQHPHHPRSK